MASAVVGSLLASAMDIPLAGPFSAPGRQSIDIDRP